MCIMRPLLGETKVVTWDRWYCNAVCHWHRFDCPCVNVYLYYMTTLLKRSLFSARVTSHLRNFPCLSPSPYCNSYHCVNYGINMGTSTLLSSISHVNPRFHAFDIVWNLKSIWDIPNPVSNKMCNCWFLDSEYTLLLANSAFWLHLAGMEIDHHPPANGVRVNLSSAWASWSHDTAHPGGYRVSSHPPIFRPAKITICY